MRRTRRGKLTIILAALLMLPALLAAAPPAVTSELPTGRYIVELVDAPVATYTGGVLGLEATNPSARGEVKLDSTSPAAVAYASYLEAAQADVVASFSNLLGRTVETLHSYQWAMNGLALELTGPELALVRTHPSVLHTYKDRAYHLTTDAGPRWIGAESVWSGASTGGVPGTKGEGIVVGIIDTGINHDHPSFAEVDAGPDLELGTGDDFRHRNPRGTFYGLCDPVTGAPFCNDKLIGVRDLIGTGPLDDHGHGSHTASTVAGNHVPATIEGPALTTIERPVSGVAPHANVISYKVCDSRPVGSCIGTLVAEAIDAAVMDMVDVINFSIGGGAQDPWSDATAKMFLRARAAGTFVATSAGNAGPGPETVGAPANAPWLLSVGASTHDRAAVNGLVDVTGGDSELPDLMGPSFTDGYGPAPIVHAADHGDAMCLNPFPPGTFDGEIVVCDRGINPRVDKGRNAAIGGAGGFVLANTDAEGEGTVADAHEIPAVHIGATAGNQLRDWLSTGAGHAGSILGTTVSVADENGDVMAGFSSRGANAPVPGVIKPDVTAPGVDVLAAGPSTDGTDAGFVIMSGTSMSSPHSAGAAALVRAVNPTWTPAEIQSALMTTAKTEGVLKDDAVTPSDPFDRGSGRVDLTRAALAGLLFDESYDGYVAANPEEGGDPTELNIPSLGDGACVDVCSWTRTVRNPLSETVTWTVTPGTLEGATLSTDLPIEQVFVPDSSATDDETGGDAKKGNEDKKDQKEKTGKKGEKGDGGSWVEVQGFTLAPGASRTITFTVDIESLTPREWFFSTFSLDNDHELAPGISIPVAIRPGGATVPVEIDAQDMEGSETVPFPAPMDASDVQLSVQGLTQGSDETFVLVQDPTPLDPYDAPEAQLTGAGTRVSTFPLTSDAPLLQAVITDTTAPDLDLFVGRDLNGDGLAQANEELCSSTSGGSAESCQLFDLEAGTYWVLVQSWLGTGANDVSLVVAPVEGVDNGNLSATSPATATRGEDLPVTLAWNEPRLAEGTTWFALVQVTSAPGASLGDMGRMLVKLSR